MGVAGMVMSSGYDALWYPVCYACGYLFLLLFIAGPLRRFGAYTIPDFAEGRFDSPVFRKIAVVFVLFIGFFYTMPQMKGAGTTLAYIFPGLPYWAGVVLVGAVITVNVALGGMKGITLVQAFQYWAKMFAISVPIFVLMTVYGHYGEQLAVNQAQAPRIRIEDFKNSGFRTVTNTSADQGLIDDISGNTGLWKTAWTTTNSWSIANQPLWSNVSTYLKMRRLGRGTGWRSLTMSEQAWNTRSSLNDPGPMNPFRLARWLEEKLPETGVFLFETNRGDFFAVYCPPTNTNYSRFKAGVRSLSMNLREPLPEKAPKDETWLNPFGPLTTKAAKAAKLSPQESKPYSLLYTYSLIIALVCGTAGLPHILVRFYTNPDGVAAKRTTMWVMILIGIFYLFPPVFGVMGRNLMPELYTGLSGIKGTDQIVLKLPTLLNEKYGVLGSILSGVTCAGAFAAFMSTFSGLLVSMTGALAHDVYGRMLRPKSTPKQRLSAFKICAVIIGAIAIVLGSFVEPLEINFMVGQAFAIAAASYFPLLFMSVWWRGMTMRGAAVGMLTGGLCALVGASLTNVSNLALDKGPMGKIFAGFAPMNDFWAHHPLTRILCEQPAIWTVPLAIVLMIVVSKATREQIPADVREKMLVLHAPEALGLKQEYIQEHHLPH
jgi:Na+(H+)/acetate symporter ActP